MTLPVPNRPIVHRAGLLDRALPGLVHGFSGSLPYESLVDYPLAVEHLLSSMGCSADQPVFLAQPHLPSVWFLDGGKEPPPELDRHGFAMGFDGVAATLNIGAMLTVRSADCVPVLAVDEESGAYAALHAGWRGVAAGILPNLLHGWRERGSSLTGVRLAFGPAIGGCCFEVGPECVAAFDPGHLVGAVDDAGPKPRIDLHAVLARQAEASSVSGEQIETLAHCTQCHRDDGHPPFASYRRAQKNGTPTEGRNVSFIGVLPDPRP